MPCVSKSSYTHGTIIFAKYFTFSFHFQCRAVPLIYLTVFQKDLKRGSLVWGKRQLWDHNNLFQDWFA